MRRLTSGQLALLLALAIGLSSFTIVFGALPLLTLKKNQSSLVYYLISLLVVLVLMAVKAVPQAITYFCLMLVVGLFFEIEKRLRHLLYSSLLAIFLSGGITVGLVVQWLNQKGLTLIQTLETEITQFVNSMNQVNSQLHLDAQSLVMQIPSGAFAVMVVALAIAIIMVDRFQVLLRMPVTKGSGMVSENKSMQVEPRSKLDFSLPSYFIWFVMFAFLGTFLNQNNAWIEGISINVLNSILILYFFQGLAVIASFFKFFAVGPIWQAVMYMLLVGQLFLFVSLLGVVDYWVEFRIRWKRPKPAKENND